MVEGAVEHASIAGRLLGTEQALEAGVLLSNLVAGAEKKNCLVKLSLVSIGHIMDLGCQNMSLETDHWRSTLM